LSDDPAVPPINLVIFDCDGVLIDSEPLAMRALLDAIAKIGVEISMEDGFRHFLGRSVGAVATTLAEVHGIELDAAALEAMRRDLYTAYRQGLRAMPGAIDTLAILALPYCIASSSHLERIETSLAIAGITPLFAPKLFSASMVERGKPAPDLFLLAARETGVPPAECLVIEDSPAGIMAARQAGMRVFAFTGGGHFALSDLEPQVRALGPDAVFSDMRALPALLEEAKRRMGSGMRDLLVAVDVGTGSARAGVVSATGKLLARAERAIDMRHPAASHAVHDSEQIWRATAEAVRAAVAAAGAAPGEIAGISFDATCSLVVRDSDGAPLAVDDDPANWDTIVWLDHRAEAEAAECTATGPPVLTSIGGVMSPEMQVPKLMWLKRHRPEIWARTGLLFDLADYLGWKASGSTQRSHCTLTCKWTWIGGQGGWQRDFLQSVGLEDLVARGGLPETASPIGTDLGPLTPAAAEALGLTTRCRVGVGLVDAHAGALGTLAAHAGDFTTLDRHLCLVAGTSSCVMALSADARPIHAVWGPFEGAVLPGAWLNEAGQSATGALLDHLVQMHAAGGEPTPERHRKIIARVNALRARDGDAFAKGLYVIPDFLGNRSPLGDPLARGVISGLTLDTDFDGLCRLYWRAAVGIALGIRHILETLGAHGYGTAVLHVTGGHTRNPLLMELYADATGCTVHEPAAEDATLLGTAIVAATATGLYGTLATAALAMQQGAIVQKPNPAHRSRYDRDYRIFLEMLRQRQALDAIANAPS
jgi:FGGY-family pentulose kinase/HAD superfamily hydrolase (TIGR01509 family)